MTLRDQSTRYTLALLCAAFTAGAACRSASAQSPADAAPDTAAARARVAFAHALPRLDGGHLEVKLVEVVYGPGQASSPHSHPCPVIGYVTEGALRTQVKGETEVIYRAGQSFYEAPNGIHQVSANASRERPAKLLAYFVCDHSTPLSVPAPDGNTSGAR